MTLEVEYIDKEDIPSRGNNERGLVEKTLLPICETLMEFSGQAARIRCFDDLELGRWSTRLTAVRSGQYKSLRGLVGCVRKPYVYFWIEE
jgi:hypothetical protein